LPKPFLFGPYVDANGYDGKAAEFRADVLNWRANGCNTVMATNGSRTTVSSLLQVCQEEGIDYLGNVFNEINPYLYNTTTWAPLADAGTQAEADAIVSSIVSAIGGYSRLKAWYLTDEGYTQQIERLKKLKIAFDQFDGTRPVFAVQIGIGRGDVIGQQVPLERHVYDIYPVGVASNQFDFTMRPFGYTNYDFLSYLQAMITNSGTNLITTPMWTILQAHDAQFSNPSDPTLFSMRRPSQAELKAQMFMALGAGSSGYFFFAWPTRQVGPFGSWTGLEDLPAEWYTIGTMFNRFASMADELSEFYPAANQAEFDAGSHHHRVLTDTTDRKFLMVTNLTAAAQDITITGTAGVLRNLEDNEAVIGVGATIHLQPGDGRVYRWAENNNTLPTGHNGVPTFTIPDYTMSVKDWWAAHPYNPESPAYNPTINIPPGAVEVDVDVEYAGNLGTAFETIRSTLGVDDPVVFWLGNNTYNGTGVFPSGSTGRNKNYAMFWAKPGTAPVIQDLLRPIPINQARDYTTWAAMNRNNQDTNIDYPDQPGVKIPTRIFIRDYRLKGWHFKGITFYALGAIGTPQNTQNVYHSSCQDFVYDNCIFQNVSHQPTPPNFEHPANVTGNAILYNIWLRNCRFMGNKPDRTGGTNDLKPWAGVYLDGLHGGGTINCVWDEDANYTKEALLYLTNDDFSRDYNLDHSIGKSEWRIAQYVVSYGDKSAAGEKHMNITGSDWLVDRYERLGTSIPSYAGIVHTNSKSNDVDNRPDVQKWQYAYTGGFVRRSYVRNMGGSTYLVRQTATPALANQNPPAIDPVIGRVTIEDNIVDDAGFSRWLLNEGLTQNILTPNTLTNNLTSGTIPPPVIGGGNQAGPAAIAQLAFTAQPSMGNKYTGQTFNVQPVVTVRDTTGAPITTYTGDITLSLVSGPPGGSLSGTTTVAAVSGVATFAGLSVNKAGSYRLRALSTEDVSGQSVLFTVQDQPIVSNVTVKQVASANWFAKIDQGAGLGVTVDVTAGGIVNGTRVFAGFRKEDNTKILDIAANSGHLAATNPWGTENRPFTYIGGAASRAIQSLATAHSLALIQRTAAGSEAAYTHNWASGSGGRTGLLYFVLEGLAGDGSDVELINAAVSGSAGTAPSVNGGTTKWTNEFIVAAFSCGLNTEDWTAPSGWTLLGPDVTDENLILYYKEFPTIGTVVGSITAGKNASTNWAAVAVRFKPQQSGGGGGSSSHKRRKAHSAIGVGL